MIRRKASFVGFLIFLVTVASPLFAEGGPYWGVTAGKMDYVEEGTVLGSDYRTNYDLKSFGTILGARFNERLSLEGRLTFSDKAEEEVFGTDVELHIDELISGFLKFKPITGKTVPYGLVGYSAGEIKACGVRCTSETNNDLSYGAGFETKFGETDSRLRIEYVYYGEDFNEDASAELSGVNISFIFP